MPKPQLKKTTNKEAELQLPSGKIKTSYTYTSTTPTVTCLIVSRGNRIPFLEITKRILQQQDYPNIIEWLFVNGSQTNEEAKIFEQYVSTILAPLLPNTRLSEWPGPGKFIGFYRNYANTLVKGELIVCFDDDDYYTPNRISKTVELMVVGKHSISGCETMYIHDYNTNITSYFRGKDGSVTANNTMAYCNQYAKTHRYSEQNYHAEEVTFIGDEYIFQTPRELCVMTSHFNNTISKFRSIVEGIAHREGFLEWPGTFLVNKPLDMILPDEQFIKEMRNLLKQTYSEESPYDITYYAGVLQPEWEPSRKDLGGSEQAIVHLSEEWAKKGRKVVVYARIQKPVSLNGVDYFPVQMYPYNQKQNTLILWRSSGTFLFLMGFDIKAKKVIVDLHDNYTIHMRIAKNHIDKIDYFMMKSYYHMRCFQEANMGIPKKKILVIPNGIRVREFTPTPDEPLVQRDPLRFVYASAYYRGLIGIACILWPKIQKLEPRAELHCYYGAESFTDEKQKELFKEALIHFNIMDHGRQPLDIIKREKHRAGFHLYPTFTTEEIDCISIRESLVAGCIPILSNFGVFNERDGFHINFTPGNDSSLDEPARQIVELAHNQEKMDILRKELSESKTIIDWEKIAIKWISSLGL